MIAACCFLRQNVIFPYLLRVKENGYKARCLRIVKKRFRIVYEGNGERAGQGHVKVLLLKENAQCKSIIPGGAPPNTAQKNSVQNWTTTSLVICGFLALVFLREVQKRNRTKNPEGIGSCLLSTIQIKLRRRRK